MRRLTATALLLVLAVARLAPAGAEGPGAYLRPGTPSAGGVRHLALVYAGGPGRVRWDAQTLLPFVAHVDAAGKPTDWLFDSFLWIEFATPDGVYLHVPQKGKRAVVRKDWQWLLDAFFDPEHGVAQLEAAVKLAEKTLGKRPAPVNLVITMPTPYASGQEFGPVTTWGASLDFQRDADRLAALQWYIETALGRWQQVDAPGVRLAGFYWLNEAIGAGDFDLVRATAAFLHSQNMRLYWIPAFGSAGLEMWRELGIDATMLQPNYYFTDEPMDPVRLGIAAQRAQRTGAGIEIEMDARVATDAEKRKRYLAYLDAGVKFRYMTDAVLGYYLGVDAPIKLSTAEQPETRELYDALYRFVKGTYQPVNAVALPDPPAPRVAPPDNLALASRGARVTGTFVPGVGLEPKRLIDGEFLQYTGMTGFAAFAWPGSFTIELPRVYALSRIETLLFDLDDRTFRYQIELSEDGLNWRLVADKSKGEYRSWQRDRFRPVLAKFIKFRGLHNSANGLFQVVEIEAYR